MNPDALLATRAPAPNASACSDGDRDARRDPPATPAKGRFVSDVLRSEEGTEIEGVFLVRRKSTRRTREGRPFLGLVLYDRSGAIDGQVWDDADAFQVAFAERDFLYVRGIVDRFRERPQVRVLACARCSWEELAPDDFLPAARRPAAEMLTELRDRVRSVANPHLRALLERFHHDEAFMKAFALSPAATAIHHDSLGGLLEHTLSLIALADAVARVYDDLDRDLLVTGAFLHDVGKVRELQPVPGFPYTDEGQLIGHVVLGYEIAMRRIDALAGFPADLRAQLGHLILSHQGEYEWGSPRRPKTLEALALHFLDNLDSKADVFRKAAEAAERGGGEPGEGDSGQGSWTDYVRTLGRALYAGRWRSRRLMRDVAGGTLEPVSRRSVREPRREPSIPGGPRPPDLFEVP